jgi:hypothetical protein
MKDKEKYLKLSDCKPEDTFATDLTIKHHPEGSKRTDSFLKIVSGVEALKRRDGTYIYVRNGQVVLPEGGEPKAQFSKLLEFFEGAALPWEAFEQKTLTGEVFLNHRLKPQQDGTRFNFEVTFFFEDTKLEPSEFGDYVEYDFWTTQPLSFEETDDMFKIRLD